MEKLMVVNVVDVGEMRIAILEDGVLEELYIERASREQLVGNIYKAKVINVETSIQAAFVDFGAARNGFLHVSDVMPTSYAERPDGSRPVPRGGHDYPPIQAILRRGQELIVQVTKDAIGSKGPTVTSYLSLAGRFLVMMPDVRHHGISRKIMDEEERQRLKQTLSEMELPADMGVIIRTAGAGRAKAELAKDVNHLQNLWKAISERIKGAKVAELIYQESDLVIRTIRDLLTTDTTKILIDSQPEYERDSEFLKTFMPRMQRIVQFYTDPEPLFHRYKIEEEIEKINRRKVSLSMGGSIVIDQTEALVAIDVNSGKIKHETDPEETAFRTNMAAAPEIARQLRLRDLGGVIINDFIDMRNSKHIRAVEKAFTDAFKRDRARTKVLRMSQFGIIEMTRQRVRSSLTQSMFEHCPHCSGAGEVKSPETMSLEIMREIRARLTNPSARGVEVIVNPRVAHYLQNERRHELVRLEDTNQKRILLTAREDFEPEKVEMKIVREEAPSPTAPPTRELVIPPEVKAGAQEKGRQDQQQRQEQQQRQGQPGHRGRRRRGRRGRGGRYQQQQVQPQAPPTPQQGPPAEKKTLPPEPSEPEKPEGPPPERVEPERDREPQTSSGQD
jgi:ribonuclease E